MDRQCWMAHGCLLLHPVDTNTVELNLQSAGIKCRDGESPLGMSETSALTKRMSKTRKHF